jgi:hypothetical protein
LHQRTIRFWLTCLVIGCVLPAALGSVFLFTISYQQQRTILERNTIATARALMQAIDAELFGVQSALQVLASSQRLASGDLFSFYRKASEALPNMGGNYIVVTDSTGQQRLNTLKPFGDPLPQLPLSTKARRVFENGQPAISLPIASTIFCAGKTFRLIGSLQFSIAAARSRHARTSRNNTSVEKDPPASCERQRR